MSNPFLGEIRIIGFSFAPRGWALCNGQLMAIAQNDALFALLGTTYGGDGQVTFGLPNLQSRLPVNQGQGQDLSNYVLGQTTGTEEVTLMPSHLPLHSHPVSASTASSGAVASPVGKVWSPNANSSVLPFAAAPAAPMVAMAATMLSPSGSSVPHDNMPPFLVVNFAIALEGVFPSRN